MNECDAIRGAAARMAAGDPELSDAERTSVTDHLRACAACAGEVAVLAPAFEALRQEEVPDPGAPYWAGFAGRLRSRIAGARRRSRLAGAAALAAAAVILVVAGLTLHRRAGSPPAPGPDAAGAEPAAGPERRAEARIEALLGEGPERDANRRQIETILDEMVPVDPLAIDDALDALSPDQARALIREMRGDEC